MGDEDTNVTALLGDWLEPAEEVGFRGERRQDFVGEVGEGSVLDVEVEVEVRRTVSVHFRVRFMVVWVWFSLLALEAREEVESLKYSEGEGWAAGGWW
jgi:hypothetical protein